MTRRLSRDDAIDAFLDRVAERGWRYVALADVARAAHMPLARLLREFPHKGALVAAFVDRLDEAVLTDADDAGAEDGLSARDRLFEVVMRRIEALQVRRAAAKALLTEAFTDPWVTVFAMRRQPRTMALMLEAAGINAWGVTGCLTGQGLALAYGAALRHWMDDETPDLAGTMATLDKALRRAEWLADRVCPPRGHALRPKGEAGAAPL